MTLRSALMKWIALAVIALAPVSCSSLQSKPEPTATGGLEFTLFVRDSTGSESFYQVTPDGSLGWAGGLYARLYSPKWSGALTADEIKTLQTLLAERQYFLSKPPSSGEPEKHIYRVYVNAPEHRTRFTVKGMSPEIEPIRELLANASLRRLEDDLDRLPQPSSNDATESGSQPR